MTKASLPLKKSLLQSLNNTLKGPLSEATLKPIERFKPVTYVLPKRNRSQLIKLLGTEVHHWEIDDALISEADLYRFSTSSGPIWLVFLTNCDYGQARSQLGECYRHWQLSGLGQMQLHFMLSSQELIKGGLVGVEMSAYRYKKTLKSNTSVFKLNIFSDKAQLSKSMLAEAKALAEGVNIARHLVNLPPKQLHPEAYADLLKEFFTSPQVKVKIWNETELKKQNMNLHLAVGGGATSRPCLVQLKYRPNGDSKGGLQASFVGKGITFDTGGLDLKPSSAMRLMKKDMGGSASLVGLCHWLCQSHYKKPCNIYLAIAENAVSDKAFYPSDVITGRNGMSVEIHNTDAEGRLVLADALDVASEDNAKYLIDVATLTGAIKVGLGSEVAGLFSNDKALSQKIHKAADQSSDLVWPMPLHKAYKRKLQSNFADILNCSDSFGGAITAALFLEHFVKGQASWAHLDIYAWQDSVRGAYSEPGGSGQAVQCLATFLQSSVSSALKS